MLGNEDEDMGGQETSMFSDSVFYSPKTVKSMLTSDEKLFEEENDFNFVRTVSPHESSRRVKEKRILLRMCGGPKMLRDSDAFLSGIAYCTETKFQEPFITLKILLHNYSTRKIRVKTTLNLYTAMMEANTDVRAFPLQMTLAESESKTLKIAISHVKTWIFQEVGYLHLNYYESEAGENDSRCSDISANTSLSISQLPKLSPFEKFNQERVWSFEPNTIYLNNKNKTGRILLKNYSNKKLKFNVYWESVFLTVSPGIGVLPAKGEIGLRISLPKKIKYGQTAIRIFCNEEKTVQVNIELSS